MLGDRFDPQTRLARPADERELMEALRALRSHGGVLGRDVVISRASLTGMGPVDVKSGVAQAGAGVTLGALEEALRQKELSLGPLSPSVRDLTVADWLEGPWAGLRAVPGGALETACLALEAVMPDGLRFSSRASPRSAAGPDLDHLFLGGEGRFGLLLSATLRAFDRPRAQREVQYAFDSVAALVNGVRAAIAARVWWEHLVLAFHGGGRWSAWGRVIGSAEGVERDLASAGDAFVSVGGRPLKPSVPSVPASSGGHVEHELSWEALAGALNEHSGSASAAWTVWRPGLESVLVTERVRGGLPMKRSPWTEDVLLRALGEADPAGVMGSGTLGGRP